MSRTLSLGNTDPDYIQHTLVTGALKSIVQGLRRIRSGDALKAGDMKQVGGEFLFEVIGGVATENGKAATKKGNTGKVQVTWCHRMRNTRDHAEIPAIRKVLGLDDENGRPRPPPQRRWTMGLARAVSQRRQSWVENRNRRRTSWSRSRGRSRSRSGSESRSRERTQGSTEVERGREDERTKKNGKPVVATTEGQEIGEKEADREAEGKENKLERIVSAEIMYAEPEGEKT